MIEFGVFLLCGASLLIREVVLLALVVAAVNAAVVKRPYLLGLVGGYAALLFKERLEFAPLAIFFGGGVLYSHLAWFAFVKGERKKYDARRASWLMEEYGQTFESTGVSVEVEQRLRSELRFCAIRPSPAQHWEMVLTAIMTWPIAVTYYSVRSVCRGLMTSYNGISSYTWGE